MAEIGMSNIYTLSDKTGVRYIGQSRDVAKRYRQHCSLAQNQGSTHKQTWIRSVLEKGCLPILTVLFETKDPNTAEKEQIAYYQSIGAQLVNGNSGGNDLSHAIRAKKLKPWGNTHSPVQRRLKSLSETVRTLYKLGFYSRARHVEGNYRKVLRTISTVGIDIINDRLWSKYGH